MQILPSIPHKWNQESHQIICSRKKRAQVLTLTFILLCFPVSPSPEQEEDVPSPASGSGSSGGSGWKPGEGKLSLCHLLLAGSPRKAALGMGGAHYVAELSPGSPWLQLVMCRTNRLPCRECLPCSEQKTRGSRAGSGKGLDLEAFLLQHFLLLVCCV